jgi:hypothetical protein
MAQNTQPKGANRFSVYAGMDTAPPVDWGTVASSISGQLVDIQKEREGAKAQIEQDTLTQMASLNELGDVNNRSLSRVTIEASAASKKELQTRMDMVRRGLIQPKDYKLFMQEQQNGYKSFSTAIGQWDKWYTENKAMIDQKKSTGLHNYVAGTIESFGNLKDKKVLINPANGQLQVVSMLQGDSGKYDKLPSAKKQPTNYQNPNSILGLMNFKEETVNYKNTVGSSVDLIGKEIKARRLGNGAVETVEDYRQSSSYSDWKSDTADTILTNDNAISDVLSQAGYTFGSTFLEAKKKNPNLTKEKFIKVDLSGEEPVVTLDEGQKKAARDIVENEIDAQLDYIEKQTQGFDQNSSGATNNRNADTDDISYIQELDIIMHGDPVDAQAALKRRIDTKNASVKYDDDKIVSFDITDDQIILRRAKGDPYIIDRRGDTNQADDPETKDIDESIKTLSSLDDVVSINDVLSPNPLSRGRIEDLIKKEKITLGKRREGNVGTKVGKAEIPSIADNAKAPSGRTILESITAGNIGSKGTISVNDSNEKIKGVIGGIISEHMPPELAKDLSDNKDLYGPTTIKQVPNMDQMEVTIGGKSIKFSTKRLTSLSEIANKITQVMNEARVEVNKNRTSSKSGLTGKEITFTSWRKDNPGGKYEDFLKAKSKK